MAKLGDICEILDSKRIPVTAANRQPGPYPYYGANGVQDYVADYIFDDELVLLAEDGGNFGSKEKPIAYRVSGKCWVNNHAHVLKPKQGLDVNYLCYSLMFYDVSGLVNGATKQKLTQADMRKIEIPVPPLDEQRRIAAILDKVTDLINKRRAQLEKLDLLVKSRFIEMFGDPRLNPMGWPTGTIRDVVKEVKYGTSRPAVEGGAYKYLRMGNITYDGHLDLKDLKYIDIPDSEIDKCIVKKGDVLFNRTNSKELVGKTCVFDLDEPMVIAGYIIRVRVNEKVLPEYLSVVLNSQYGKQTLADMCKAIVGQANINAQELQNIQILIPPIELQCSFLRILQQTNMEQKNFNQSLDKLEILKKALMQQYFG